MSHRVTLIPGDGVGPEITESARRIIEAAGVAIDWEVAAAGAEVFKLGDTSGVPRETRDSIERTGVALKGPLETPVGFGEKSANVTLRKLFETYANIRPARQMPGVPTRYDGEGVDFIVVRENIEDLYAGVEYDNTRDVSVAFKIDQPAGLREDPALRLRARRARGPHQGHLRHQGQHPQAHRGHVQVHLRGAGAGISATSRPEHLIIDNVAHQMAKDPAQFDVVVTTNLAGDIISDLASGLVGGLGFAASGNYGDGAAIFEAVHGSAPKYAGKNVINPTALILSSVMMLRHLGEDAAAQQVEDAVFVTLEEGKSMTLDVARAGGRRRAVHLDLGLHRRGHRQPGPVTIGALPDQGRRRSGPVPAPRQRWATGAARDIETVLHGVDIYVESRLEPNDLGHLLETVAGPEFRLELISTRARSCTRRPAARWTTSAGGAAGSSRRRRAVSSTMRPSAPCWRGSRRR